jgi:hypothetical protein
MGEYASDSDCLTFIRALKWDTTGDGNGNPRNGMIYFNTGSNSFSYWDGTSWIASCFVLSNPTNLSVSGDVVVLQAGQITAFGDVCYIASDGKATLIKADAIATMSGLYMCAESSIALNGYGKFLCHGGIARNDAWTWTVGGLLFGSLLGTSGNTMTHTKPSGTTGYVIQVLGIAQTATKVHFLPNLAQVELV